MLEPDSIEFDLFIEDPLPNRNTRFQVESMS